MASSTPKLLEAGKSVAVEPSDTTKDRRPDRDDELIVTWEGKDDPWHPHNWPLWKRIWMLLFTSCGGLVCLMSGSMLAPALEDISQELRLNVETAQIALSIYVLAFAFGPLVLAPLTEVYGRRPVWLAGGAWYIIWNTVCGFTSNSGLMIVSRFLAGCGASVEFATASPINADTWRPEQRGQAFAIATFLPLLGPALGPIISGFINQSIGWRWLFYVVSIFEALLVLIAVFLFFETKENLVLAQKARALRKQTGLLYQVRADGDQAPVSHKLSRALSRPFRMLATQPPIQVLALFGAYTFGVLYIVLSTFDSVFTTVYGEADNIAGLNYLALVTGYTIAAQAGGRVTDAIYRRLKERADGAVVPEYRVPLMVPGALLIPIGLLWYGWAAQGHAHWAVTDVGAVFWGCGYILNTQATAAYVMESYRDHVASAAAASQFLRSVAGFAFPIFAPSLYDRLGYGWGNTVLALVFSAFMIPAPFLLWRYGAQLRAVREWKE